MRTYFLPRPLHPGAWWVWALALAVACARTTNPLILALLIAAATLVTMARRPDQPWGANFRLYLAVAAFILVLRTAFRALLAGQGPTVIVTLPTIRLPQALTGATLLGPISAEALLAGFDDGLSLAAMVVCVGAANSLANPKRLLAAVPGALHEYGTAVVVALTVFPQLAESAQRVNRARVLRSGSRRTRHILKEVLVPVLADALDRSLALAAAMDSRGYGRSTRPTDNRPLPAGHDDRPFPAGQDDRPRPAGRNDRPLPAGRDDHCLPAGQLDDRPRLARSTPWFLVALLLTPLGVFALLSQSTIAGLHPLAVAVPLLLLGVAAGAAGFRRAGRRTRRTRYRPDHWRAAETCAAGAGVAAAAIVAVLSATDPVAAYPATTPLTWPTLPWPVLLAAALAALPAFLTPPPEAPPASLTPPPDALPAFRTPPPGALPASLTPPPDAVPAFRTPPPGALSAFLTSPLDAPPDAASPAPRAIPSAARAAEGAPR